MSKINWAYGVTTVPSRCQDGTLEQTLASLYRAGFTQPRLFVDGGKPDGRERDSQLEVTYRYPKIGHRAFANWILSAWELYLRDPAADRIAIFQDDITCTANLRRYLESCPLREGTYWNLWTHVQNQELAEESGTKGWFESNQRGRGALALVFPKVTLVQLLGTKYVAEYPQDCHMKSIDGAIIRALRPLGVKELCHNPSLVQHTGILTTFGSNHTVQPPAPSFPGEDFDATELLT